MASAPALGTAATPVPRGPAVDIPGQRRNRRMRLRLLVSSAPLAVFAVVAVAGPALLPYDPVMVRLGDRLKPPAAVLQAGTRAWLGTDQVGKDLLAQVLQGARISLFVGVATVIVAGVIGLATGVGAGFFGGTPDALLMRLADLQLAFPSILLAILIAAVLGPSVANVIITLSVTRWVTFARVARASTLVTKEREFVMAAHATGADLARLVRRHIVPFAVPPLIVVATVEMGLVILAEASLSFLGLGAPADHPSWGLIIANGRNYLSSAWWISTMPGIALSLVVIAIGQFGDTLRDCLDPRAAAE